MRRQWDDLVGEAGVVAADVVADVMAGPDMARLLAAIGAEGYGYTLHLDFQAEDVWVARSVAAVLAEALGSLRPDVDTHSAMVSRSERAGGGDARAVFCLAGGPHGELCGRLNDHDLWHVEQGDDGGARWGGDAGSGRDLS